MQRRHRATVRPEEAGESGPVHVDVPRGLNSRERRVRVAVQIEYSRLAANQLPAAPSFNGPNSMTMENHRGPRLLKRLERILAISLWQAVSSKRSLSQDEPFVEIGMIREPDAPNHGLVMSTTIPSQSIRVEGARNG